MNTIVVTAALREKLLDTDGVAELRDEAGTLIGHFTPAHAPSRYEADGLDVSDEELDRRERDEPRYDAEQVIGRLQRLR